MGLKLDDILFLGLVTDVFEAMPFLILIWVKRVFCMVISERI